MIALVTGIIIGFLMCIPIGPINVWVINTHLKHSAARALSIAVGGSLMDFLYFFFILSGLSFITFGEQLVFWLKVFGIILIFCLGIKELTSKVTQIERKTEKESPNGLAAGFLLGVVIYTSNPTLVVTMTALGATVKSFELFEMGRLNIFLVSLGLAIGSVLWFVFLIKLIDRFQEVIRNKYLNYFTKVSGALMIALSLFMASQLYI
ncbi:LysE family translocator [Halobacteriovorax sp. HLS]|uniref:LysE family translocator n=1 Tax=Halobacteriovorax sp. HLS TaxID=2234000 RepID=UPI000FDA8D97|nr:LysE family transporter [Halobacteriovorax sp. HLS]